MRRVGEQNKTGGLAEGCVLVRSGAPGFILLADAGPPSPA